MAESSIAWAARAATMRGAARAATMPGAVQAAAAAAARRGFAALAGLLLAFALAFATAPAEAASRRDRDLAALRAVHDAWLAAYTGGDVAALERFYGDDSVIMPDGRPAYRGWSEIRAFFAPGFERWSYAARADLQYLDVSGDLGTARGVVTLTFTPKAGGAPFSREMRYLIVFKRQPRGDWRILLDMDNRAIS